MIGWTTKTYKAFGSRRGLRNLCQNSMHTKLLCNVEFLPILTIVQLFLLKQWCQLNLIFLQWFKIGPIADRFFSFIINACELVLKIPTKGGQAYELNSVCLFVHLLTKTKTKTQHMLYLLKARISRISNLSFPH